MRPRLDHVQTTTLVHRLQARTTSVVETQPTLYERGASHTHSTMLASKHAHETEGA